MFAVPGWKIAIQTPVQELSKPVKQNSRLENFPQSAPSPNSKKRKRDRASEHPHLASTSVAASSDPIQRHARSHNSLQNSRKRSKTHTSQALAESPISSLTLGVSDSSPALPENPRAKRSSDRHPTTKVKHGQTRATQVERRQSKGHNVQENQETNKSIAPPTISPLASGNHWNLQKPAPTSPALTPLQAKMRAKLTSARFRYINETLYTTSSADALQLFADSPDLFADYHAGFSQQVKDSWPQNPVDMYISVLQKRGSLASTSNTHPVPLPRRKHGACHIADLGCGDAPLARALQPVKSKLGLKFVSFDLHAPNEYVTKADIAALPLGDGDADVAIFCLSLMGTNWLSFVEEAWRVLRGDGKGEVWVSEVKSRFGRLSAKQGFRKVVANSVGKRQKPGTGGNQSRPATGREDFDQDSALVEDEREASKPGADDDTDLEPFITSFLRRGFALREGSIDKSNRMFVSMVFTKVGIPRAGKWKGVRWTGKSYEQINDGRARNIVFGQRFHRGQNATNEDDELNEKDEGKLLKPCVYKLR